MPLLSTISALAIRKHITFRHYCLISIIWTGEALQWFRNHSHVSLSSTWPSAGHSLPGGRDSAGDGTQLYRGVGECKLLLSQTAVSVCFFLGLRSLTTLREKGQPIRTPDLNEVVKLGGHHGETLLRGRKNLTAL